MKFYFVLLTTFILLSFSFSKSLMAGEERLLILVGKPAQMIADHVLPDGLIQCERRSFRESTGYMECRMPVFSADISISDSKIEFTGDAAEQLYKSLTLPEYEKLDIPNSAYNQPSMKRNSDSTVVVFKKQRRCYRGCCGISFDGWIKVDQANQWVILMPLK